MICRKAVVVDLKASAFFYAFENEQSKKFSHVKGTSSASLNSFLLPQKFYQVCLSYFVFGDLYFPFFGQQ